MSNKEIFLKKHLKVPVEEFQNNVCKTPFVSVSVQTYQHVSYIAKCLDGILMQQTNFDFEILVGEDASSDGTRDICIQYAKKHPEKIRLFLHSRENNIQVYGKPTAKFNSGYSTYSARGKYIAICEGDDYWIDPLKLQKQVDFLEMNDDYGMIFSDVVMIDENDNIINTTNFHKKIKTLYKSGFIFWDLLENNFINTLTVCFNKDLYLDYLDRFGEKFSYDFRVWLHIASYTKIKYIDEKWAHYRVHNLGMSRSSDFFVKRAPLVQQSALVNYMSVVNLKSNFINRTIFSKTAYNILRNKKLPLKDKSPIIKLLKNNPKQIVHFLKWIVKNKLMKSLSKKNSVNA